MPKSKLRSSISVDEVESIQATREKIDIERITVNNRLIRRPKFVQSQISPSFRSVGGIETDEVEYDNYVKWVITLVGGVPPCINPTTEPTQYPLTYEGANPAYIDYYANSFEEGVTDDVVQRDSYTFYAEYTMNNAELFDWGKDENKHVLMINPGGSVAIRIYRYSDGEIEDTLPLCLVKVYAIGCPGDAVKISAWYGEESADMTGDWLQVSLSAGFTAVGTLTIEAPSDNSYPVFVDSIECYQCY